MGFLAQNQPFSIMFFFYKKSDLKIYATETMKEVVRIKYFSRMTNTLLSALG